MTDPTNPSNNGEQLPNDPSQAPYDPNAGAPGSAQQPNFEQPGANPYSAPGAPSSPAPGQDPYAQPGYGQQPGQGQQPGYGAPQGGQYGAPGQPYGAPGGFQPQQASPQEEVEQSKNAHMFSAVGAIFGWGWLVAIIFYFTQKDKGAFIRQETAKAMNFQVSMAIYAVAGYILATVLLIILVGVVLYLIPLAAWAMGIIFGFTNASKVGQGGVSKYPLTINMVK